MNSYNPLTSAQRLEAAGMPRKHAEAIAGEINEGNNDLVTEKMLESALAKQTIRIGVLTSGIVAVATAVLGLLISI